MGQMLFAGGPLGTGEDAGGGFEEASDEFEDGDRGPRATGEVAVRR